MTSKGRMNVLAVCSIFVLLIGLIATIAVLRPSAAVKAASSLNYHGVDHMGSEYRCLTSGTTTFDGPVDQWPDNGNANQQWSLVSVS